MSILHSPAGRRDAPGRLRVALPALALILVAAIVTALLAHQSSGGASAAHGNGVAATQSRSLPRFTAVDLAGANNVSVRVGMKQSVIVHADSNLLGRVTTHVQFGRLVIGNTPGGVDARTPMFIAVNVPSLSALTLVGSGNITVTGITGRSLTIALSGRGVISASGTVSRLDVTIAGSGTAMLAQLIARDVKAALGGDGSITLVARHGLDASISGSGTILYSGNPSHITTSVTGTGTITAG